MPSPSLMPQLQSSPNGAAAPPVVMRTSMSGEIAIAFGSLEELNGLLDKLGAGEA